MSAGVYIRGQCVDAASAPSVAASYMSPYVYPGFSTYFSELENVAGVLKLKTYSVSGGGAKTLVSQADYTSYSTLTCDTSSSFMDGVTMGWGVVLAMVAAWVIHNLRRGL